MERGKLVVERVGGKSTVSRCFFKYPFKFIVPNKLASSQADAVWVYTITYGGGIVSGDSIAFDVTVRDGCNAVLTTQSSTKVYKSIGSKCSEQLLEASIGGDALLVVIPDPVTCFSTARYSQTQNFRLESDSSSLLLVDWITSGRHERGEKWAFSHYKSTNRVLLQGTEPPVFLDTILLEQGSDGSICERMKDYQAIAMIVVLGPKLKHIESQMEEDVKKIMSEQLQFPSSKADSSKKPSFIACCSKFGSKVGPSSSLRSNELDLIYCVDVEMIQERGIEGVVVRVASITTEAIYSFLQHQLAAMEHLLGAPPYR